MADEEGFEPPEDLHLRRFSRPVHSTTLPLIPSVVYNDKILPHKINNNFTLIEKLNVIITPKTHSYQIHFNRILS